MRSKSLISAFSLIILVLVIILQPLGVVSYAYNRADFPSDFVFGASSSASQVEGAVFEDGRTPSIIDAYFPRNQNKTKWDRACDEYHKYKEDVKLMADMGLEAYKLSISWSRLIPNGKGSVNPKAVEYYNSLINELISHGIEPHVLLLHADSPQALEDEYGGWLSRQIVKDFTTYANVCFREFGDRVLHWTTHNEPNILVPTAYDLGLSPPNRCSPPFGSCTRGNSTIEPYIVAHNCILAHASVVKLYKKKYQRKQHGHIGLDLFTGWFRPETDTREDSLATQRARDFLLGWFLGPLLFGDYPDVMKKSAGSRLPTFTEHESKLVKNSFDFIGVNCYGSIFVNNTPTSVATDLKDFTHDIGVSSRYDMDMGDAGEVVQHVLEDFKQIYGNPPIYIYENGYQTPHNSSLNDTSRIEFLNASIGGLLHASRNGSNVKGYFVWSFMDTLELLGGEEMSFGLYYVDFDDADLRRYPRRSAQWYSEFLKTGINYDANEIVLQVSNSNIVTQGISSH